MKFKELFTILAFCSAATFTMVDIGFDYGLVGENANNQYFDVMGYEWGYLWGVYSYRNSTTREKIWNDPLYGWSLTFMIVTASC